MLWLSVPRGPSCIPPSFWASPCSCFREHAPPIPIFSSWLLASSRTFCEFRVLSPCHLPSAPSIGMALKGQRRFSVPMNNFSVLHIILEYHIQYLHQITDKVHFLSSITLGSSCPFHAHRGPLDLSSITLKHPRAASRQTYDPNIPHFPQPLFPFKETTEKRAPNSHSIPHFLMAILPPPKRTTSAETTNTQLLTLWEIKRKIIKLLHKFVYKLCTNCLCTQVLLQMGCVCVCFLCVPADRQILFNNKR